MKYSRPLKWKLIFSSPDRSPRINSRMFVFYLLIYGLHSELRQYPCFAGCPAILLMEEILHHLRSVTLSGARFHPSTVVIVGCASGGFLIWAVLKGSAKIDATKIGLKFKRRNLGRVTRKRKTQQLP